MKRTKQTSISPQVQRRAKSSTKKKIGFDGNTETMISTGSTLLDLAITGGRVHGGGIPGGILVEIFGPSGCGKTVMLCEIGGAIQRAGGSLMFHDPEARLNQQFAKIFDLDINSISYDTPDTIPALFQAARDWKTSGEGINGIMADSLAALSTEMEMGKDEGDKMGMRRAKEFSEELRRTCRVLAKENYLMVASNQVRVNVDAGKYGQKYSSPGGEAIGFYSSVRLRASSPAKIKKEIKVAGKIVKRIVGVTTQFEVFKNSTWKPYRTAPVTILFDYGIDDVRQNLQYIKDFTRNKIYTVAGKKLAISMDESIQLVEQRNLEGRLKREVIRLWTSIEEKFDTERKTKKR